METIKLNNGLTCPVIGIGTYMLAPAYAQNSVREALKMGYRLIDTANAYVNERAVGRGMRESGVPREEIPARMEEALRKVGIPDLRDRTIGSLSGGQRQKVAIASILALKPQILVLDEPTGELDPRSSRQVFSLLRELNEEQGVTVIIIEQKIMLLCEFARQLAVLSEGKIVRQGDTRAVLEHSEELEALGVNCPRVMSLSRELSVKTGEQQPVCVNLDEAEAMVRRLIG